MNREKLYLPGETTSILERQEKTHQSILSKKITSLLSESKDNEPRKFFNNFQEMTKKNQEESTNSKLALDDLPQVLRDLQVRLVKLEKNQAEIEKIREDLQSQINTKLESNTFNQLKDNINNDVEAINDKVSTLSQQIDHLKVEHSQALEKLRNVQSEQEDLIFEELRRLEEANQAATSTNTTSVIQTGLSVRPLELLDNKVEIVDPINKIADYLADNFKAIGLIKGVAKQLADEVLAGLKSGEWVMFSGSLAYIFAEVCAKTIAAQHSPIIIHIPVGLLNGQQFSEELAKIIRKSKNYKYVSAIIVEGINRSAVECYAQALRQIVTCRLLGMVDPAPQIIFLGTLVEGPATLPISAELCELGPVFNTDVLSWSSQLPSNHYVSSAIHYQQMEDKDKSSDEFNFSKAFLDIFRDFPSHLWQLCAKKACSHLNNEESALTFGWLIPRTIATERNWSAIQKYVEEQNIKDERIKKLLRYYCQDE